MIAPGWRGVAAVCLCACALPLGAYLTFLWTFDQLAQAPVLAAAIIETTSRDPASAPGQRTVMAHAVVRVLRSYPPSAFLPDERIRLDYEALPEGAPPFNGPDVARIHAGDTLVLPLKANPQPASAPWRLLGDQGDRLVVPAIAGPPRFPAPPRDERAFLLHEIASALLDGTRPEVLAAASYASSQKAIGPALVTLLASVLPPDDDRWPLIAALSVACLGVPRPTVEAMRADRSASLAAAVLGRLGPSEAARRRFLHQLLASSDIAAWGVGMTVPEFVQEPVLVEDLRQMLRDRRPGALTVARSVLIAGQKAVLPEAASLSFDYLAAPPADLAELQAACWVIRDFGSDAQFRRLVEEIRASQYRDRNRYDALWRNILWSDNPREQAVLDLLLQDDRIYQGATRYRDIARGELTRIEKNRTTPR